MKNAAPPTSPDQAQLALMTPSAASKPVKAKPEARKVGRKTKFTPEYIEPLLKALSEGHSQSAACAIADVSVPTYHEWMQVPEFSNRVSQARAKHLQVVEARIAAEAKTGDWRAGAWWLERQFPAEYGRKDQVNVKAVTMTWEQALQQLEESQANAKAIEVETE
jgi:transposase